MGESEQPVVPNYLARVGEVGGGLKDENTGMPPCMREIQNLLT